MKKKMIIIISVILLIALLVYKSYVYYMYDINVNVSDFKNINEHFKVKGTKTVKSTKLNDSEYLLVEDNNLKIKIPKQSDYKLEKQAFNYRLMKYENENVKSMISFGLTDSYIEMLNKGTSGLEDEEGIKNLLKNNYLEKDKIKNDIELVKYLANTKNERSFLNTTSKTKKQYYYDYIEASLFPQVNYIELVSGDLEGYILYGEKYIEVSIIKNNKKYYFTFVNTNIDVYKFLNNLVIE